MNFGLATLSGRRCQCFLGHRTYIEFSPLQQTPGRGEGKTGLFPHRPPPPAIHPLHLPSSPPEFGRVGVAVFTRQGIERWASMPTWTSTLVGSSLTTHLPFPTPLPYRQVYIRFMILISNTTNEKEETQKVERHKHCPNNK